MKRYSNTNANKNIYTKIKIFKNFFHISFKAKHYSYNVVNSSHYDLNPRPPFSMLLPFEILNTLRIELGMMDNFFFTCIYLYYMKRENKRNSGKGLYLIRSKKNIERNK